MTCAQFLQAAHRNLCNIFLHIGRFVPHLFVHERVLFVSKVYTRLRGYTFARKWLMNVFTQMIYT